MRIPKKISVLGVAYTVKIVSAEQMRKETGSDTLVGQYDCYKRQILIKNVSSRKEMYATFLHEWAHALMWVNGVSQSLSCEMQEVMAQTLSYAIQEL